MKNFIKKFRKNKHLSQQALADKVNTTKATISQLERGGIQLTQDWMERISKILECHSWELISESVHIDAVSPPPKQEAITAGDMIIFFERHYPNLDLTSQQMVKGALQPLLDDVSKKNKSLAYKHGQSR